jgi:thiosulfate dehydrogenase
MSCHGTDGSGNAAAGYPGLAGLNADYLAKQLHDFTTDKRHNAIMSPMAKALSKDDIDAVSAYYAAMKRPSPAQSSISDDDAAIARSLVQYGDWSNRGLPACSQCHGPKGEGVGQHFPELAGQNANYIKAQLQGWQKGTRSNSPLQLMKSVAGKLTDTEINAVAAYYAILPGKPDLAAEKSASGDASSSSSKQQKPEAATGKSANKMTAFQPPSRTAVPEGPLGDAIRQGEAIFNNTSTHPASSRFVGNHQACSNCHLDAGRLADSAPLWAAWVSYPAYRSKNKKVNTYIERLQGCFNYSMNAPGSKAGQPPGADSDAIVSLVAYSYWLAQGAPTGDNKMTGRGYPELKETAKGFDPDRGATVFRANCSLCHGDNGQGTRDTDGRTVFPPLWGNHAYNWGAGMHKINTAASFIRQNMPLGLSQSLTKQQAWDVAAFINSHDRPQDPRYNGELKQTTDDFHSSKYDYYGKRKNADGKLLGQE